MVGGRLLFSCAPLVEYCFHQETEVLLGFPQSHLFLGALSPLYPPKCHWHIGSLVSHLWFCISSVRLPIWSPPGTRRFFQAPMLHLWLIGTPHVSTPSCNFCLTSSKVLSNCIIWTRSVLSTNAYPAKRIVHLEIGRAQEIPKPFLRKILSSGVLTTTHIAWYIPCIGMIHAVPP